MIKMKTKIELFKIELNSLKERLDKKSKHSLDYFPQQIERYSKVYKNIKNIISKEDKILDVGCSPFHFTICLKNLGYNIVGVDKFLEKDKEILEKEKLEIKKCDIEKERLPFEDETFDKIIFLEVFEHLYNNQIFVLKEIRRVLKKDGVLIFATPNAYSPKRILKFIKGKGLGDDPYESSKALESLGYNTHIR